MPKASEIQSNFNNGEISSLLYGRVDLAKYKASTALCLNWIPLLQGPLTRRPGTMYLGAVKTESLFTRLVRFRFSTQQAYILEFGNQYVRIWKNGALLTSGSPLTPIEITTPYTTAELRDLKFEQSADVLYIAHSSHPPAKIARVANETTWTYTVITFLDGPYETTNSGKTTITPSATTGSSITLTASATTGINNDQGFLTTDVGRFVRLRHGTGTVTWGYAKISARTNDKVVTAEVLSNFGAATATVWWRLGTYSATTGYPTAVCFHEDRLIFAGAPGSPERFDGSKVADYENFAPSDTDGTVTDSSAIGFSCRSGDVQQIRWLRPSGKGLLIGTFSGEWVVTPSTAQSAITPTSINARPETSHGSSMVDPVFVGKSCLFVPPSGRKLREFTYVYVDDGFKSPDMTSSAKHITVSGIVDMAFQKEPQAILWGVLSNGTLIGFTYDRDESVTGWHKHTIGGNGIVESVAVIPTSTNAYDEVYMVVKRTINGSTHRYIEKLKQIWNEGDDRTLAQFVDSSIFYNGTPTTTIAGLSHLVGETVQVLADGSSHPDCVVQGDGSITLSRSSSKVAVGYGYNSDCRTLRNNAGSADGTAQGKLQRTNLLNFRVQDTSHISIGPSFDELNDYLVRSLGDDLGTSPALFTGDKRVQWPGGYSTDNVICFRCSTPLPATILALFPIIQTNG